VARRPGSATKDPDIQHILKAARDLLEIMNRELGDPNDLLKSAPNLVPPISCDVLYIEDDLVNFTLVERILEFRPALKLLHAVKGETGIELAQIHLPKLILLDLNLPDMHGSEVLEKLQSNPQTAQLPVVVFERRCYSQSDRAIADRRARNYLTKPFDIDPFLASGRRDGGQASTGLALVGRLAHSRRWTRRSVAISVPECNLISMGAGTGLSYASKAEFYRELAAQCHALIDNERDPVATWQIGAALVFNSVPRLNWVGFYLLKGGELVSSLQGQPACVRIALGTRRLRDLGGRPHNSSGRDVRIFQGTSLAIARRDRTL